MGENRLDRRSLLGLAAATTGLIAATGRATAMPQNAAPTPAGDGGVHLGARTVYPPRSISEAARTYLAKRADAVPELLPPASDKAAWRRYVVSHDSRMFPPSITPRLPGVEVETRTMGGVTVYVAVRTAAPAGARKPHVSIHGGGWTNLGGKAAMLLTQVTALQYGGTVYGIDYRTPPDHPYPAPLDDCLAVYREVVREHRPDDVLMAGGSAGGNLAAATLLKARDAGLPMPRALFLDTPVLDLTRSGDTLVTNEGIDVLLHRWTEDNVRIYAEQADVTMPYLSPLRGDFSKGWPTTYLRSGTRDLMLSDTVRMHAALRKAGVESDLYVREAMPHAGFGTMTPDDAEVRADTIRWMKKNWMAEAGA